VRALVAKKRKKDGDATRPVFETGRDPRRSSGWELQQFQEIQELGLIYNWETPVVKKKTASHRTRAGKF
jgi:hypothetical protein